MREQDTRIGKLIAAASAAAALCEIPAGGHHQARAGGLMNSSLS